MSTQIVDFILTFYTFGAILQGENTNSAISRRYRYGTTKIDRRKSEKGAGSKISRGNCAAGRDQPVRHPDVRKWGTGSPRSSEDPPGKCPGGQCCGAVLPRIFFYQITTLFVRFRSRNPRSIAENILWGRRDPIDLT